MFYEDRFAKVRVLYVKSHTIAHAVRGRPTIKDVEVFGMDRRSKCIKFILVSY